MKPPHTHRLLAATLLAAATLYGCNDNALVLVGHADLRPEEGCAWTGDRDGPFLTTGVMDITLTPTYTMLPVFLNQGDSDLALEEARVTFATNVPALNSVLSQGATLPLDTAIGVGKTTMVDVALIHEALGRQIQSTGLFDQRGVQVSLLAEIEVTGRASGDEVVSNRFSFLIDVCAGCLLWYPPGTLSEDSDGSPTCEVTQDTLSSADAEPVCVYGQDAPLDCRLCRDAVDDPDNADALCDP